METKRTEQRVTALGIDPGRETGLYSMSIPKVDYRLTKDDLTRRAHWLGNAVITVSSTKGMTQAQRWGEMADRIESAIEGVQPDLIVLEYPADGMTKWSGGTGRGTDFHLGMYFGFALLAANFYGAALGLMPVTSSKAARREGWMPKVTERSRNGKRVVTHTQSSEATVAQCRDLAQHLADNAYSYPDVPAPQPSTFSKHELMALGVLAYYVTHRSPADWGK